jgi:hypothetical protein
VYPYCDQCKKKVSILDTAMQKPKYLMAGAIACGALSNGWHITNECQT